MKVVVSLIMVFLFSCESKPSFEYYTSPDKQNIVTLMKYDQRIYFTRGRYNTAQIPLSFIWPISGIENAYYCHIHWCGKDGVEILSPYGEWLDTEKDPRLKFRKIDANEDDLIMKNKTGEFVYCYGNIVP